MSLALGDPPCSGVTRFASGRRRAGRKARDSSRGRPAWASGPGEARGPLLNEGHDALQEVLGRRHLLLDVGLQIQLLVHSAVDPVVELTLGPGVGAGWA